jgi:hypothetical protein
MAISQWPKWLLITTCTAWVLGLPAALLGLSMTGGNLGFTLPFLLFLIAVWVGVPLWLSRRWRHRTPISPD